MHRQICCLLAAVLLAACARESPPAGEEKSAQPAASTTSAPADPAKSLNDLVEAYFEVAEEALDLCIVDEASKPVIQSFRVDLGAAINPDPLPEELILGANSRLLENADFLVTELTPAKPFDFDHLAATIATLIHRRTATQA